MRTEKKEQHLSQLRKDLEQWDKMVKEAIDEWIKLDDLLDKQKVKSADLVNARKRTGEKINNVDQARQKLSQLIANL